jgi:hypothetical protein
VGSKPLPKTAQVVDHTVHLLSQRAVSKTELPCKTEKQTVNCNKAQTAEGVDVTASEKGGTAKK